MIRRVFALGPVLLLIVAASACRLGDEAPSARPTRGASPSPTIGDSAVTPTPSASPTKPPEANRWVTARPAWLGKRILPPGIDGFGAVQPTPPVLRNRRFATIDLLPRPKSRRFSASIAPVPERVARRSSWRPQCPVSLDDLSYVKMTFWGFDHLPHMGEMLVHAAVAHEIVGVFQKLFAARFPIEEMRVVTLEEVRDWKEKPTGDTNVTSSFECREAVQSSSWSQHAYGLAIDVNPFHNPYARGDLVAPELASAYLDRTWVRPGMVVEGGAVVRAFDSIGWGWGGRWSSLKDWMHFSQNGR